MALSERVERSYGGGRCYVHRVMVCVHPGSNNFWKALRISIKCLFITLM